MAFDPGRYEAEVIRPLRRQRGRPGTDDLLRIYAVEPAMSPDELRARLKSVRTYWNQYSGGVDGRAQVCKQLLAADAELVRGPGVDLSDPGWWRQQAERRDQAARALVEQLSDDVLRAYGPVGKLTQDQLALVAGQYPTLTPAQVDTAVSRAKLVVVDVAPLPTTSGLDRTAYRELGDKLRELRRPTVIPVLYPDLTGPFTLVQRFPRPLGRDVVLGRQREAERRADSPASRAEKSVLRLLLTGLDAGADLRTVALFQIVEQCLELRATGAVDVFLVRRATELGLTKDDAELLVASLPRTVAAPATGPAQVRALLAEGRLRGAEQALAGVAGDDPEYADLERTVRRQAALLRQALDGADAALRGLDEAGAERLLHEARRIATDDPDIEQALLRLPPPPPRGVTAVPTGATVKVSWHSETSRRYRVVRTEGRPPAGPDDGVQVGETDPAVPVARDVHYAVFAAGQGGVWSRPAVVRVRVVPPIEDVDVHADPDQVTASWAVHPDCVRVTVVRRTALAPRAASDGSPVRHEKTSFVDRGVQEGLEYFYGLTAVYHDARHAEVEAPMTVVSAWPRAAARPVDGMIVTPLPGGRVRVAWPAGPDPVVVRVAAEAPEWTPGTVLAPARAERYGRELVGVRRREGDLQVLEAEVPGGPQVYVPFAIGGTGAVVGTPVHRTQIDPVTRPQVRRTGGETTLTWVWPGGVSLAEVRFTGPDGRVRTRRLTRAQYRDQAGCVLPAGPGVAEVFAVVGTTLSAPAGVRVEAAPVLVRYHIKKPARLSRRRIVELVADEDCAELGIVVVVRSGLAMPLRAEDDATSFRFSGLRLVRQVPVPLDFELPGGLAKPYWIRCFTSGPGAGSVSLIDPPVTELKVA